MWPTCSYIPQAYLISSQENQYSLQACIDASIQSVSSSIYANCLHTSVSHIQLFLVRKWKPPSLQSFAKQTPLLQSYHLEEGVVVTMCPSALTATCTKTVRVDVLESLRFQPHSTEELLGSMNRSNSASSNRPNGHNGHTQIHQTKYLGSTYGLWHDCTVCECSYALLSGTGIP